jgi:hypothetical protein
LISILMVLKLILCMLEINKGFFAKVKNNWFLTRDILGQAR